MQEIHDALKRHGKHTAGYQSFMLVWSEQLLEKRFGLYRDYTDAGVLLREVEELREVKKLNYINERWVLVKYLPAEQAFNPVIPETMMGSYEPLWVFEDSAGNFIAPSIKVVEFLVSMASGETRVMNATERAELAKKAEDREIQDFIDMMDCSPLTNALHLREAVTVL